MRVLLISAAAVSLIASCGNQSKFKRSNDSRVSGTDNGIGATPPARFLSEIIVSPAESTIIVNAEQGYQAVGVYSDGIEENITAVASWKSGEPSVARMQAESGEIFALALKPGESGISATHDGLTGSALLKAVEAPSRPGINRLKILPGSSALPVGATEQFRAYAVMGDGSEIDVTAIAKWSDAGEGRHITFDPETAGQALAVAPGSTRILAIYASLDAAAEVEVTDAELISLEVVPGTARLYADETFAFIANGVFNDGQVKDVTETVTWSSSDDATAGFGVSGKTGTLRGLKPGTVTVTADMQGISAGAVANVIAKPTGPFYLCDKASDGTTDRYPIKASVFYFGPDRAISTDPDYSSLVAEDYAGERRFLQEYFDEITQREAIAEMCMTQFAIAPRAFSEGFPGVNDSLATKVFEWFTFEATTTLVVPADGDYTFRLNSDDGTILFIDGLPVITHDGQHSPHVKDGGVALTAGEHALSLRYFQGPRIQIALELWWRNKSLGENFSLVPEASFKPR